MSSRVVVFLDYANVRMRAREAFGLAASSHVAGQISPLPLARRLLRDYPDRELKQIRVYRGIPVADKDRRGYSAARRQISSWERDKLVKVIHRPLQYPDDWPVRSEREKGIDVSLAVDFVVMAVQGDYDVGILMSTDTDLKPALEAVAKLEKQKVEVAAWHPIADYPRRLAIKEKNIWCHWLDQSDYESIADPRDYNVVTKARDS